MNFKAGDKVIRTGCDFRSVARGGSYEVEEVLGKNLRLVGHTGVYVAEAFALAVSGDEQDPNGLDQHAPGAKVDAGKTRPTLTVGAMARAHMAVAEVGTFGANKYTDGGWIEVANGFKRYEDAQMRHVFKRHMGETYDPDSKLLHLAHEAWNAMAKLDLYLREQEKV